MNVTRVTAIILAFSLVAGSFLVGCADDVDADPRRVVMAFFGAMEKNDEARIARLLDLATLMKNVDEDYAVTMDKPRVFTNPRDILLDLTGDGLTKKRWFSYQRIINNAEVMGEHATVEVTFVDKEASRGYMTKFGLHKMNEKWRIYSFKTFKASN